MYRLQTPGDVDSKQPESSFSAELPEDTSIGSTVQGLDIYVEDIDQVITIKLLFILLINSNWISRIENVLTVGKISETVVFVPKELRQFFICFFFLNNLIYCSNYSKLLKFLYKEGWILTNCSLLNFRLKLNK